MRRLLTLLLLFAAATASARVISYAPYSDSLSTPAVQNRLNRHFVLFEVPVTGGGYSNVGQVVVYDTLGLEEPRVALSNVAVISMAAREDDQQLAILVQLASPTAGMLSVDGGRSWKNLALPASASFTNMLYPSYPDTGGPIARGRYAQVRIGTRQIPFYFASSNPFGVFAIAQDGSIRTLFTGTVLFPPTQQTSLRLIGTSVDGSSVLFTNDHDVVSIDASGTFRSYGTLPAFPGGGVGIAEGWIAPDGGAYVEQYFSSSNTALYYLKNGTATFVAGNVNNTLTFPPPAIPGTFYAVPAGDYNGAWMILRDASKSTVLLSHVPNGNVAQRWADVAAPEVEALIAAKSNTKVLIQVHRPRLTLDQLTFKDPAIAVWHVGDPAPKSYDELFLSESLPKGFVHVDVDKVESGDPFVFDSGGIASSFFPSPIVSPAPPSAGGSDVVQEWGVVRASLAQRLVLPGVGRTNGAFGSFWQTDVTIYNPSDQAQTIQVHYAANGNPLTIAAENTRTVSLAPFEIRTIPDVLKNLFLFESGGGALYIVPAPGNGVNVTSRTYSTSANGTYGFGMNAIDVFAAASPRFPVTFSGALPGRERLHHVLRRPARPAAVQLHQRGDGRRCERHRRARRHADARRGRGHALRHRQPHQRLDLLPARHPGVRRARHPRHRPPRRRERLEVPHRSLPLQSRRHRQDADAAGEGVGLD
jgi:hypothetical protein